MGSLLRSVSGIRWGELHDATGAAAGGIPPLLSRIAYGDEDTARIAIDDLGDAICALGFVVGEATAPTVPFLLELVGSPHVACKAELLDLLGSICRTDQWHSAAAAAHDRKHNASYRQQPGWEATSRTAVYAGRSVIEGVASSMRSEEATPAQKLLQEMDDTPPFPEL
ncbi:hypothetical protein E2C00_16675 [Streptomyces sp. WAC05374]|uniref:hypothetical protein n=1 Tax=Streptomyces sp. WAC05374 TaxID=2487420 RepID=UPI000F882315|nr:hypothetical protein [Streptomyces sp. WAC05374]RST13002.1 hypothetical protein EF905_21255 [Streptomyces sp. WAC05374]TDF54563.1 hypothetical protein E2C00_16675 [Streptomyces sp. WAC05374]TDF56198.1 hypothetical protein E2C02_12130 [Streptomyces sp. WAC05374]